ncbi:MAG: DNA-binding protein [Phenylobacterium sp.]|uniref:helix-turn-helix transcriptional regulator n=1 Tax=Phenylobacterium sp. TaxID=1871053 RepID=UPI001A4310EF|nr:DNA-binding protein [Phenylobacterium sp.]MBL8554034.1 DNA-binding protein [Phenylobacterium sp.]
MPKRPSGKDRTSYQLALQDVVPTFDPLEIKPAPSADPRHWVMEAEAARMLGLSKKALESRRARGTGPAHHKRYGYAAYYLDDLDAWAASKPKGYRAPAPD